MRRKEANSRGRLSSRQPRQRYAEPTREVTIRSVRHPSPHCQQMTNVLQTCRGYVRDCCLLGFSRFCCLGSSSCRLSQIWIDYSGLRFRRHRLALGTRGPSVGPSAGNVHNRKDTLNHRAPRRLYRAQRPSAATAGTGRRHRRQPVEACVVSVIGHNDPGRGLTHGRGHAQW